MISPPPLKKGDTVGIVAPAKRVTADEIQAFISKITEWGLLYKTGDHLYDTCYVFSSSDENRARDFQQMIDDPEVKAIFCARGGYGSIRTLQQIDFSSFEQSPKWIIGYSDITVFHSYVNKFTGVETLHSMMPFNFAENPDPQSIDSLKSTLFGGKPEYSIPPHELNIDGEVDGELAGGNLSVLCSLNGTVLFPDLRNKILFIEDVDEYLYSLDRMIMNLSLSGVFNRIKALMVGDFTDTKDNDPPFGKSVEQIISEITDHYNIPVCFNVPAGHKKINKTLIFGRKIHLSIEDQGTKIRFS